jgi:hypothetical protein
VSRHARCLAALACVAAIAPAPALAAGPRHHRQATRVAGELFPSNRLTVRDRTQRTGLRVALPKPDCTARPSDCEDIDVLNTLDGFNLQPRISIPFSAPIDVASVSSRDVYFKRLGRDRGRGGARVVGIAQIVWDPAANTLYAESDALLDEATTYALVVTTGVRDASGARIAARRGSSRRGDQVAAVSVFTTQSSTAIMRKIRRQLDARTASPARFDLGPDGERTVFSFPTITGVTVNRQVRTTGPLSPTPVSTAALNAVPGAVGELAFGTYRSPDYENGAAEIPAVGTRTGVPAVRSEATLTFSLVVPSGPEPAGGWPVAIFGHGYGGDRTSSFAVAATMANAGIATIAINAVGHGFGPDGTLTVNRTDGPPVTFGAGGRAVDLDNNGAFDATEGLGAVPPRAAIAFRDGINQTVIDLMALVRTIRAGVDIDGDGSPDLSTFEISYFGQSLGGIYGTVLMGLDPDVRTGVLNVPGGPIVDAGRLSPNFRPLLASLLGARTPSLLNGGLNGFTDDMPLRGEPPVTDPVPGALAIQQRNESTEWAAQSGNPVAWAPHVPARHVIVQFARGDQTAPNPMTTAILRAGNLRDRATFFRNDLAFAADPTMPKNPHGFMTRIVGGTLSSSQIAAQAQQQIATFFASGGATTIDPDGPGPLFETPIAGPLPEDLGFIP